MNRKIIMSIIIVLIVTTIGILIGNKIYINNESTREEKTNKSLLVVDLYSNYAWGISFSGSAIFDDGSIYSWKFNGSTNSEYEDYIGEY